LDEAADMATAVFIGEMEAIMPVCILIELGDGGNSDRRDEECTEVCGPDPECGFCGGQQHTAKLAPRGWAKV
jgi:hypothetical protein